ncbi:MAG: metallophosphoesterase [Candidatus Eisenbacteria sp.]|nr:metallophosphoesterase [Candidatus Eisenbacteria bacterium]
MKPATQPSLLPAGLLICLILVISGITAHPATATADGTRVLPIGDTLTVIQRPLLNIPALVRPGDTLQIECAADPATIGWAAQLEYGQILLPLEIAGAFYDPATLWWTLEACVPPVGEVSLYELYDLEIFADGGIADSTANAVRVIPEFKDSFYFIHITDTHLPTHLFYYEAGAETDTSEVHDLRTVMDDISIINPEFVLLTGDLLNEGELEDFQGFRYYTRAQRLLSEFDVPVYLTSGNHDIGGWSSTPPPAGTARRDWWRFFGWARLDDPPPGAPWRTQNYSFDYGSVHFAGLEAYDNYDMWRSQYYGAESFTSPQLQWLADDLAAAGSATAKVLFYHFDFSDQINLTTLGVDLALWGHIHRDEGSLGAAPYDLATNNVCDEDRSYRLIRVVDGDVFPQVTIAAGGNGNRLLVEYSPANDGTHDEVIAQVYNSHHQRFEHGQLRFLMPSGSGEITVTGGTLTQVDQTGSVDVCYVAVDIQSYSVGTVTATKNSTGTPEERAVTTTVQLHQNRPNPFTGHTRLSYVLPDPAHVRLTIQGLDGRELARLVDRRAAAGNYLVEWTGESDDGLPLPAGIYFACLVVDGELQARKMILGR